MTYKAPQGRFYLVMVLGLLVWSTLVVRFFQVQVVQGKTYRKIADRQHQLCLEISPQRGAIYDRNLQLLAFNLPTESFFAIPESLTDISQVAEKFSAITSDSPGHISENLRRYKSFAWLKRGVEREESRRISSWNLAGVFSKKESKRIYPFGKLTEEIVGFTDVDNQGLAGVEYQYDDMLKGKTGEVVVNRDALKNTFALRSQPVVKSESGKSLVLTLDLRIQAIIEEELQKAIQENRADGGTSIWMDPQSGEILAMVHCPKYDQKPPIMNRAISDNFEPGSTFKIVTAIAALEEKLKNPDDSVYAEKGKFKVNNRIIHDVHEYGWLTFKQSLAFSSNIAFAKIAMEIGKDRIHKYARSLGFGLKTGIDLPGESKGTLPSFRRCSDFVLSTFAIGQGVSSNSLQLINAYAAIANGGNLMRPYVLKMVLDQEGNMVRQFHPQKIRQAIAPQTCEIMNDFLVAVVDGGTGNSAKSEGLQIAGKTGTAQKPDLKKGGYKEGEYLSSFVGYFPASQPKFVGMVCLDNPKGKYFGSQTAAPAFKNMAQRLAALQDRPLTSVVASAHPTSADLQVPTPAPASMASKSKENPTRSSSQCAIIPNALGMTIRQAAKIFSEKKMGFRIIGSGVVKNQAPSAGGRLLPGQVCLLYCQTK